MEYRLMGSTGVSVSRLCLGTMTFGKETDEEGAHAQLDAFVEAGGNFVDTADVYQAGVSEEVVGRWFASRDGMADQIVLATKGRFPMGEGANNVGLTRKHLTSALDGSLRRLGVERIDVYQVHAYDPLTPLEETLRFMDDAVSAGKISYFGLSNFLGWQIAAISELAVASGRVAPVLLQPVQLAHALHRARDRACLPGVRARDHPVESARRWVADWEVRAGLDAHWRVATRRGPEARHGELRRAQRRPEGLGHPRRREGRGGAQRSHDGAGVVGVGGRPGGRGGADRGEPYGRAARGGAGGRRQALGRGRSRVAH